MVISISSTVCSVKVVPTHAKTFHMVVEINGVTYEAGSGKSKKIAEQHAAQLTLEKLMADK